MRWRRRRPDPGPSVDAVERLVPYEVALFHEAMKMAARFQANAERGERESEPAAAQVAPRLRKDEARRLAG